MEFLSSCVAISGVYSLIYHFCAIIHFEVIDLPHTVYPILSGHRLRNYLLPKFIFATNLLMN